VATTRYRITIKNRGRWLENPVKCPVEVEVLITKATQGDHFHFKVALCFLHGWYVHIPARMAKLVDAPGLGPDASNGVGVRVPLLAPQNSLFFGRFTWQLQSKP
jgi:hypothetical protein